MNREELKEQLKGLCNDAIEDIFRGYHHTENVSPLTAMKSVNSVEDFKETLELIVWCNE